MIVIMCQYLEPPLSSVEFHFDETAKMCLEMHWQRFAPSLPTRTAIFLPALNKARKKACQIACIGNQKTLSTATPMYLGDNSDVFPLHIGININTGSSKFLATFAISKIKIHTHLQSGDQ